MNLAIDKSKKIALSLMLGFLMLFAIGTVATNSFSTNVKPSVDGVEVKVDDNGKLVVSGNGMNYSSSASAINAFIAKYKTVVVGISGLGAVSMLLFFIYNFLRLGSTSANPQERSKVITGLVWSGLAAAGLGAVSLIVGFFYNALK